MHLKITPCLVCHCCVLFLYMCSRIYLEEVLKESVAWKRNHQHDDAEVGLLFFAYMLSQHACAMTWKTPHGGVPWHWVVIQEYLYGDAASYPSMAVNTTITGGARTRARLIAQKESRFRAFCYAWPKLGDDATEAQ